MSDWWNRRREVIGDSEEEATLLLRWAVERAGLTQDQVAERLGWSRTTVSHYLSGRRKRMGWRTVLRWMQVCGFRVVVDRTGAPE